jgi:hypothetical protein
MKFFAIAAIASLLITGTVNAQHVNFGVKAGLNLYNIHDDNSSTYDTKPGLHVGLLGHIHLDKNWAVQPELLFSGQGAKYTANQTNIKLNLGYINVPVMVQYMFDNGFRIEAGPQLGFLVSAKAKADGNTTDVKENLKTVDFALGFGLGYIHVPSGFGVDARYNLGLSNINKNSSVKSTNRGFQLGVFYQFKHS